MAAPPTPYSQNAPQVDVNRALAEANQILSFQPTANTSPQSQAPTGVRLFASLPSGDFGMPTKDVSLNRAVRTLPSANSAENSANQPAHTASALFGGTNFPPPPPPPPPAMLSAAPSTYTPPAPPSTYANSADTNISYPQSTAPAENPTFGQFLQTQLPSEPNANANTSAPPKSNRTVTFYDGTYVKDTDTSPLNSITPSHNDAESVNMSILKTRKVLDTPKPDPIEEDDEDDEEMWTEIEVGSDEDEFDDEPLFGDDESETQEINPVQSVREFRQDNPPRITNQHASLFDTEESLFSEPSTSSTPPESDTSDFASSFILPGQRTMTTPTPSMPMQDRYADLPMPTRPTMAPRNTEVARKVEAPKPNMLRRGVNYMKGIDAATGIVNKSARNKRIIVACIILLALCSVLGGLWYWKIYSPKRSKRRDDKNKIGGNQEAPAATKSGTAAPANATKPPKEEAAPTNATTKDVPKAPAVAPILPKIPEVSFDSLARDVQNSVAAHVQAVDVPVVPSTTMPNEVEIDIAKMLDTENTIL